SPMGAFAVESVLDVLAQKIGMDPPKLRLKNAARKGTQMLSGATLAHNGYAETIEALLNHPGYTAPLGKNQGRGVASGYWFNGGGESSATMHVNEDGTVVVATGSPDIGGSRASMAIMAAETLGGRGRGTAAVHGSAQISQGARLLACVPLLRRTDLAGIDGSSSPGVAFGGAVSLQRDHLRRRLAVRQR